MAELKVKAAGDARWDCVSFGEVMLRFDPGFGRVRNARSFKVWEGGGEYNVARAMRKCWGMRAAVVTALPQNDLGWLVEDLIMQGGVDMSHIIWRDFDGIGRNTRVGLNFTEKGFGIRPALGCSDRGHSAASQIQPGEVDWEKLFGEEGVRWFHTGGIFAALASNTAEAVIEAVDVAQANTAPSWRTTSTTAHRSGRPRAARTGRRSVNREIAQHVDVMIGNEEDFTACLGFEVAGADEHLTNIETDQFKTHDRGGGQGVSELPGSGDHPAQREDRELQRLVGDPLARRPYPRVRASARTSRSTIASAAATVLPRAWPTHSSRARERRRRWSTAPPMARSR